MDTDTLDDAAQAFSGEIWWAYCSVTAAVLDAVQAYSTIPPSEAMRTDMVDYRDDDAKKRPVIVLEVLNDTGSAVVVPLATFHGANINRLSKHFQQLAVSVGGTAPWPTPDSRVIRPAPSWPKSLETPCYAIAHAYTIPLNNLVEEYTWSGNYEESFGVDAVELRNIRQVITERQGWYRRAPASQLRQWNDAYDRFKLRRDEGKQRVAALGYAQSVPAQFVRRNGGSSAQRSTHTRLQPARPLRPTAVNGDSAVQVARRDIRIISRDQAEQERIAGSVVSRSGPTRLTLAATNIVQVNLNSQAASQPQNKDATRPRGAVLGSQEITLQSTVSQGSISVLSGNISPKFPLWPALPTPSSPAPPFGSRVNPQKLNWRDALMAHARPSVQTDIGIFARSSFRGVKVGAKDKT